MKSIATLALTLSLTAAPAWAEDFGGYEGFKKLQTFLLGTDNWGKSADGDCRFDFELAPGNNAVDGITNGERLQAAVNLDKPKGEFSLDFKDVIGRGNFFLTVLSERELRLDGGDYDGSAELTFLKNSDGSVFVYALWVDNEMGPDRSGYCVLPYVRK